MSNAQLMPPVANSWLTANGLPLAGGQIFSYIAGTSTPQATYTDETAATPNTNPVVLNSAGQAAVWLRTDLAYKIVVEDSLNNVLATYDNILITNAASIDTTKLLSTVAGAGLAQNISTKAFDVQVDGVTTDINGSNQIEVKPGAISPSFFAASSKLEVLVKRSRDLTDDGLPKIIPQYEWTTPSLLSVGTNPPSAASVAKWSANGEFLAVGSSTTPFIDIYQASSGPTFTKLADPGTLPTGAVADLAWSPCGDFLAITHGVTPYITIYQRSGNSFTKLSDPGSIPGAAGGTVTVGKRVLFSPNSDFLALTALGSGGTQAGPQFIMYERSGTTFTDITANTGNLETLQFNHGLTTPAWSPNSSFYAMLDNNTGLIVAFKRTDFTFTSITAPVASYSGNIRNFSFSPDGNFFAVELSITPWILIFTVSSVGVFSLLTNPITLSADPGIPCWSANSEYLMLGKSASPFFSIYQVTNPTTSPTFTIITDVVSAPGAYLMGEWSPSKQFLAICSGTTPYVQIYQTSSTLPNNAFLWTRGYPYNV